MPEFFVGLIMLGLGTWLYTLLDAPNREAEAIQRGYALHCPQTGDFAWKGECND